jgi:sugar lactone lactonase YvrE
VVRFSQKGEAPLRLSVRKISSLTFSGDRYDHLYFTTAGGDRRESEEDLAGSVFRVQAKYMGASSFFSRIHVP